MHVSLGAVEDDALDAAISPRGFRLLAKVPRLPGSVVDRLIEPGVAEPVPGIGDEHVDDRVLERGVCRLDARQSSFPSVCSRR